MASSRSGERLRTVRPLRRTSSGSRRSAALTRFCTSTCALSMSVPTSKVTVTDRLPSLVDCEAM